MRHKPMLLSKLSKENRGRFREVIGLIGTHHGVGVTHTGLLLAFYFGEVMGKKTAYLECNRHRDMQRIEQAYEWNKEEGNRFSYHRITCFKEVRLDQIPQILGEDYEYIILDFGTDFATNQEELLRCSVKLVIAGQSEWDILKLKEFMRDLEVVRGSEFWRCCLVRAQERTLQRLRKEIKQRLWAVPEVMEPTRISHTAKLFIKQCLSLR